MNSSSQLTLNLEQGSIRFNFSSEAAQELREALSELMEKFKVTTQAVNAGDKPQPQPPTEYRHTGEVFLEVFCNPNIYPTPFAAKVLVTIRDDRIRLTTEAELTRLVEDVTEYLEQHG
ncbi:hypothetical protein PCC7418_0146 [Halothece sp. PCC 7418]|uniref:hypothetical protein n=1 Tax=Halothece sp. (strain PCC 7418) TaxID=65093 RepID=UPI0002A07F11|nr:hypothetical protein [Halothece sp. PCC 7418]AFZ42388.1 hypothetical protein PCC7418_0146 [Halothece sp. PCC 7418]